MERGTSHVGISVDVAWESLNKHHEEPCGDKVEVLKTADSDIVLGRWYGERCQGEYSGYADLKDS